MLDNRALAYAGIEFFLFVYSMIVVNNECNSSSITPLEWWVKCMHFRCVKIMAAEHPYKLLLAETKKANQKRKPNADEPETPAPEAPAEEQPPKRRAKAKAKSKA